MDKETIKTQFITGIILGVNPATLKIPNEFREFLKKDDQGMDGFQFMLKDSKLSKRIPSEVRLQYEVLRSSLSEAIKKSVSEMRKTLDEIEDNPDSVINEFIERSIDKN